MAQFNLIGPESNQNIEDTLNDVSSSIEYRKLELDFDDEISDMLYYSGLLSIHDEEDLSSAFTIFLTESNLSKENILKHSGIPGYIIIQDLNQNEYIIGYNPNSGKFYLEERTIPEILASLNISNIELIEDLSKKERLLSSVMYAIEHIFQENDDEWMQRLNEDDTFTIDSSEYPWSEVPEFAGKTHLQIQELQVVARKILTEVRDNLGGIDDDTAKELGEKINTHEEKYLDYVVGIGDIYEGGANAFHSNEDGEHNVTEDEITTIVESIVSRKSVEECFRYMIDKHAQIEANNYQSTEVMRTYAAWNKALSKAVLYKMKNENVEDKLFLQYAKLVSGRDVPGYASELGYIDINTGQPAKTIHSLDSDLFDVDSASEALLFVFEREGGIMSKISAQITIEDPIIERMPESERNPKHIFEGCAQMLEEKVDGVAESGGEGVLAATGFGNLFSLTGEESYNDLSISQKMQISILVRLSKRLSYIQERPTEVVEGGYTIPAQSGSISMEQLSSIFIEVAEDGQDVVIASINDNFDGGFLGIGNKDSSDFEGLEEYQAQVLDLYNDIWGNGGIFDPSDTTIEWIKFGAQFGAILIGSIALGMAALPVLTTMGVLSVAAAGTNAAMITSTALASVAVSRIVMPEGYDSNGDMLVDIGTDCLVAVLFGRIGGVLTQRTHAGFTAAGGTWTSGWTTTAAGRTHLGANLIDLSIFGIGSEVLRNIIIRSEYIEIPFTDSKVRIPFHIDENNRFSYTDFHEYVAPQIREYFLEQQEIQENTGQI